MGLFPRYLRHWDGNAGWDLMGTRWGTRWESYNNSHACNWDSMGTRWGTSWENKICPMPRFGSMNGTDYLGPSRRIDRWCSLHWFHWSLHPRCTGLVVHCCANSMCWLCQIIRLLQVQQKQTAENCISVLHTSLWAWHEWPMFGLMSSSFWCPQLPSAFSCMSVCACRHLATGQSQSMHNMDCTS